MRLVLTWLLVLLLVAMVVIQLLLLVLLQHECMLLQCSPWGWSYSYNQRCIWPGA